jgi:predicted RNase H-like nuclease (RuvC/YqgF family)
MKNAYRMASSVRDQSVEQGYLSDQEIQNALVLARSQLFDARFKIEALKRKLKNSKGESRSLRNSCQRYDNIVRSLQEEIRERKVKSDADESRHCNDVRELTAEVESLKAYLQQYKAEREVEMFSPLDITQSTEKAAELGGFAGQLQKWFSKNSTSISPAEFKNAEAILTEMR